MSYIREIPRDLFNEAKILKCLGRLALLITDGKAPPNVRIMHKRPEQPFAVDQNTADGTLYCGNIDLVSALGEVVQPWIPYNDRDPWPLHITDLECTELPVFTDHGDFTEEFLSWATGDEDRV